MPSPGPHLQTAGRPDHATGDATAIAFVSHGLRIGIALDARCDAGACDWVLPPGWTPTGWRDLDRVYRIEHAGNDAPPTGDAAFRVVIEPEPEHPISILRTCDAALEAVESDMHHYIAEFASRHLFVHAGVVGWDGGAIVLPGRSYSGKTTLVTGLVRAGATYYSDEYAVLDEDGLVHPFPRRTRLRDGPFGPAGRYDLGVDGPTQLPPLPARLVAALTYRAQEGWNVEPMDGAAAILAVCNNTVAIRRRPADAFAMIQELISNARSITGTRGDVDEAVSRVLDLCARSTAIS